MTPTQYKILKIIDVLNKTNPVGPTHQEIAKVAGNASRQSATGVINRLQDMGYVARKALDRRNVILTKKGKALLK